MAKYAAYLGKRVEVIYRSGEIYLPATGRFAGDSGRSVFLEESFQKNGAQCTFRWEIPYQYISRIQELPPVESAGGSGSTSRAPSDELLPGRNILRFQPHPEES